MLRSVHIWTRYLLCGTAVVSHVVEVEVVRPRGLWPDAIVVRRLRPEKQDGPEGFQQSLVVLIVESANEKKG